MWRRSWPVSHIVYSGKIYCSIFANADTIFFPALLALFVCTRCCSENELLGCRWFSIQDGFWGNPALTVDGKCRRVTVKRQVFQEIDIYSLNRPNPSPLPPRLPLLTLPAPITVFLTSLLSTCIVHYIPIVPLCPLQTTWPSMYRYCIVLYGIVLCFGSVVGYH